MKKKKRKSSKKKGTKRRSPTKKRVVRHAPKKHLAANLGLAASAYKVATDRTGDLNYGISPVAAVFYPYDSLETKVKAIVNKTLENVKQTENVLPGMIGVLVSYGGDVPLVGPLYKDVVKKPADRFLGKVEKALTGKKRAHWKW